MVLWENQNFLTFNLPVLCSFTSVKLRPQVICASINFEKNIIFHIQLVGTSHYTHKFTVIKSKYCLVLVPGTSGVARGGHGTGKNSATTPPPRIWPASGDHAKSTRWHRPCGPPNKNPSYAVGRNTFIVRYSRTNLKAMCYQFGASSYGMHCQI